MVNATTVIIPRRNPVIAAISQLTDVEFGVMDSGDLLDVIRMTRGQRSFRFVPDSLSGCDRELLINFAFLARDVCREEMHQDPGELDEASLFWVN